MSMSPDGSMFAVGGQESADCQLFQVEQRPGDVPVFTPHQTLVVGQVQMLPADSRLLLTLCPDG